MEIAILGGGIAGISTAIALKQNGFDVSVYERHDGPSHIGAGIVVWPNATFVLDQLGVLDDIKAVSGYPGKMQRYTEENDDLGAIDIQHINQLMGYPSLSILRSDLLNILTEKLESLAINIRYNHSITHIEINNDQQTIVQFHNGSTIRPDIIIGADGRMASQARQYIHGDNKPVFQGFINWIGVFESPNETFQDIVVSDYWGVGKRFGIVPVTKHKAYWAGGMACDVIGPRNPREYTDELLSLFGDWPQPVQTMIRQSALERINKIYVHDHDPVQTWHKHNLIMIGDAAHAPLPTSGQGACQALEDAWYLSNCLTEHTGNLELAFKTFTQHRLDKTTAITMAARGLASSLFNRDPDYCLTRNEQSKQTDYTAAAVGMSRLWGQHLPLTA